MSNAIKHIRSKENVDWKWPVQIGFLKDTSGEDIVSQFNEFHWLKTLAHGYLISRTRNQCNILILSGSFDGILRRLSDLSFAVRTDLLVLLLNEEQNIPRDFRAAINRMKTITANSYYFVSEQNDITVLSWLDELIFHLSHNQSIDLAVGKAGWIGSLAITTKLKLESKLDKVFENLIKNIRKKSRYKNYKFDRVFTDDIQRRIQSQSGATAESIDHRPSVVLKSVIKNKSKFRYDHETDESSIIRDIAVAHSNNVSDMVETLGARETLKEEATTNSVRFLQCVFLNQEGDPVHHALVINENYELKIKIDVPDQNWLQAGSVSDDEVPVPEGKAERVDILLRYGNILQQGFILLPAAGSSSEAIFNINIPDIGETDFELFAFHRTRLFQQVAISVFFCSHPSEIPETPGMKTEMITMPRSLLSDFDIKEQYGLSVVFSDGLPLIAEEAEIREIRNESHINAFNDELRKIIETYVKSENPDDDVLVLSLAKQGSLLYTNLFQRKGRFDKPIQIISGFTNHFPLEFLYTEPLTPATTKLCPHASDALREGSCRGCNQEETSFICPFGFLCLRTVIERHQVGENVDLLKNREIGLKNDVTMNREAIPVLSKTIFGTSEKVEKVVHGLRSRVSNTLTRFSTRATEVTSWNAWKKAIEENPDSLVIIGHVESATGTASERLEIGNDLMEKVFIDTSFLRSANSKVNPVLILIGCSTQDVNMSFMDFTQHFKNSGAAIVLSTFTKIRGSHAGPIVEKLFEVLHENKNKEIRFGEAMLKLRQILFAEKLYVSMAMVSHGDADWKLKI